MKLFCHIGIPNAAMTNVQNHLYKHQGWLKKHGVTYADLLTPDANQETLLFASANVVHQSARAYGLHSLEKQKQFREKLSQQIAKEVTRAASDSQTMLMSSASLSERIRHPKGIENLKNLLAPHFDEIKIVVYVQRQGEVLLQAYMDAIRAGEKCPPFDVFLEDCLATNLAPPYLYYRRELSHWIDIWGQNNLIIRRVASSDFINGDILADFLGVLLETWEPDLTGLPSLGTHMPRLSAPALEFARQLQEHLTETSDTISPSDFAALVPFFDCLPEDPKPVLSASTSEYIMKHFSEANAWLRETFTPRSETPFFSDHVAPPTDGNVGVLTQEDTITLTGTLFAALTKAASAQ